VANNAAFEILYREYYVRVFGLCRRLLNSHQAAEDATQEVFMRAYKSFGKYKSEQPFWQWIAAIANNYCIDLLRKRSRTPTLFGEEADEMDQLESDDVPIVEHLLSMENVTLVNTAIAALPEKYRVPLVLEADTYAFATLIVLIAAAVSALMVRRQLDHLHHGSGLERQFDLRPPSGRRHGLAGNGPQPGLW